MMNKDQEMRFNEWCNAHNFTLGDEARTSLFAMVEAFCEENWARGIQQAQEEQ